LPIGCTVTAILVANDLRDLEEDKAAGKITTITLFGRFFGHLEWIILVAVSFLTITILAFAGGKLLYLLPLLAIFQAIRAFRLVWLAAERTAMAQGLRATSRLHLEIGLLLSLGVVLSKFISS
jgi:1,4-dihydroxy-2-naphthoate octaprenyltransferase